MNLHSFSVCLFLSHSWTHLGLVVQTLDSAIHRINHYPADGIFYFRNTYPLDRVSNI